MAHESGLVGIVGWKNSGKTQLTVELVRELKARRISVSTLKHAHHGFDIDHPGKDSFLHREAGAEEVLIASDGRWALLHENADTREPCLAELITKLSPVDVILAEGFKSEAHPKLEVHRDLGKPLLARDDSSIIAVITPEPEQIKDCPCPVIARHDLAAIADLTCKTAKR